ncbi:MAG: ammonium transporter [Leptolyngbyaceae cyanobacterium MO_188.B28]|nr:ammonium transporter [Leptolyngbyaceae cyanobacterium MO_188.B28]
MSKQFRPRLRSTLRKRSKNLFISQWRIYLSLAIGILLVWCGAALAQDTAFNRNSVELTVVVDTLWVVLTGMLVFFMNAGFAMLETGLCRSKNAVSLLAKNLIVFGLVMAIYWAIGFGLMFGDGNPWFGAAGFFLSGVDTSPLTGREYDGVFSSLAWAGIPLEAKFFFQVVFAGAAATIVSGAVAERIKFFTYFIFSMLLVSLAYSITGHWIWGGGWLANLGFYDFAGSTVVHSVGGWAALTGTLALGPRLGRYVEGKSVPFPGHNLSIATLGCMILWLGWFGFNAGSTLQANPSAISHILLTTNMAAAMGAISAAVTTQLCFGKPDLTMIINGVLAGLVSITGACAFVSIASAAVIGMVAGVSIVFSVDFFDNLRVDDPVGALSVHLIGGIWGTLAVGFFSVGPNVYSWYGANTGPEAGLLLGGGLQQLGVQGFGAVVVGIYTVLISSVIWLALKYTIGLRVSPNAEKDGLDLSEHAMEAYPGFLDENE